MSNKDLQTSIYKHAQSCGFWDDNISDLDYNIRKLLLIHSEISEAMEALRQHCPVSEHVPTMTSFQEELADIVIRCMDLAEFNGFDLMDSVEKKHAFNLTRSFRHGGKAF